MVDLAGVELLGRILRIDLAAAKTDSMNRNAAAPINPRCVCDFSTDGGDSGGGDSGGGGDDSADGDRGGGGSNDDGDDGMIVVIVTVNEYYCG